MLGGELAALGLCSNHPSSYLGCSARGCSSPWHHLVTRGLITGHWGPAQALLSCLPREVTLPVVGRAGATAIGHKGSTLQLEQSTQRKLHLGQKHPRFQAGDTETSISPAVAPNLCQPSPCGTRVMSWELVPRKFCTVHLRSRGSCTRCSCRVLLTRYSCSSAWYEALVCTPISADSFPSSRVGCPLVLHLAQRGERHLRGSGDHVPPWDGQVCVCASRMQFNNGLLFEQIKVQLSSWPPCLHSPFDVAASGPADLWLGHAFSRARYTLLPTAGTAVLLEIHHFSWH